jgi:hypothetical protein
VNPLIEDYLRASSVRYFRGHHDDEYFFLADFLAGTHQVRLHVRLGVGHDRGEVELVITPDRYYPGARRERIATAAAQWGSSVPGVQVELHQSADPALVGVVVGSRCRPAGIAELTGFVDRTVAAAVDFFAALSTRLSAPDEDGLRDAGQVA